jgi:hypothetical protein
VLPGCVLLIVINSRRFNRPNCIMVLAGPRLQDTALARISQAGVPDIFQWASWRTAEKTAVENRQ